MIMDEIGYEFLVGQKGGFSVFSGPKNIIFSIGIMVSIRRKYTEYTLRIL